MTTGQRDYDVIVETNVKTKMRDGITLYSDLYRPASEGRAADGQFSTILVRTFRNKELVFDIDARFFASKGFILVFQDIRGRFKSEGNYYHGRNEAEDGCDTIEWIAKQPWSNGKVGMTGISYLAAVQQAAASLNPPHLSSLFHVQAPLDYYNTHYRRGGETCLYTVPIVFMFAADSKEALANPALAKAFEADFMNARDWVKRWPVKRGMTSLSQTPFLEGWLLDPLDHPDYDGFWKEVPLWQPMEYLEEYSDIPGFYFSGWFDTYQEDQLYAALAPRKKKPLKLTMGPWLHNDFGRSAGDIDFGSDAIVSYKDYNALQLKWFRQTLNGEDTGILEEPRVKIFVMGGGTGRKTPDGRLDHGGKWRFENEWPLTRAKQTAYYLHDGGGLSPEKSTQEASSTTYAYDPENPVPTIGSNYYFLELTAMPEGAGYSGATLRSRQRRFVPYGPHDQRESPKYFGCSSSLPLSSRHDVLVFQTPPLTNDLEVTGPIVVKLWASSSVLDTDFTAKLIDVHPPNTDYPDGYAMNVSNGLRRACYRNGFERSELMKPGERYEITIDLPAISNLFTKGHRLRLDISSSNYPESDVNPNTGVARVAGGKTMVADNTVYHDSTHPSRVILPVIP